MSYLGFLMIWIENNLWTTCSKQLVGISVQVVETHSYTKSIIITCVAAAPSKAAGAFFISLLYTTGDAW